MKKAILAALCLAASLRVAAQSQPDETLPGFKPDAVYTSGSVDNVSVYNGDPNVTIPIGPSYPLSGAFSWQPTLYYSNRFWRYFAQSCPIPNPDGPGTIHSRVAVVHGFPTVGTGWTFHLGMVQHQALTSPDLAYPIYHSPDGGRHRFPYNLGGGKWRTQDGTRLRIEPLPGEPLPGESPMPGDGGYIVTTPDGTIYTHTHRFKTPLPVAGTSPDFTFASRIATPSESIPVTMFGLKEVRDRLGNLVLTVSYQGASWKIASVTLGSPSVGEVRFNWKPTALSVSDGQDTVEWDVLESVDMPTVHGRTLRASFAFNTPGGSGPPVVFKRNDYDDGVWQGARCPSPVNVLVPFLDRITIAELAPPGGEPPTPTRVWGFRYSSAAAPNLESGSISEIQLPTGGRINYTYGGVGSDQQVSETVDLESDEGLIPDQPQNPQASEFPPDYPTFRVMVENAAMVVSRTETDDFPDTPSSNPPRGVYPDYVSTTTFARVQFWRPRVNGVATISRRVIVKRPTGNGSPGDPSEVYATAHIFNADGGQERLRRVFPGAYAVGAPIRTVLWCYASETGEKSELRCGYRYWDPAETPPGFDYAQGIPSGSTPFRTVTWYGQEPSGQVSSDGRRCVDTSATSVACTQTESYGWDTGALRWSSEVTSAPGSGPSALLIQPGWRSRTVSTTLAPLTGFWLLDLYTSRTTTDDWGGSCPTSPCSVTSNTIFDTRGRLTNSSTATVAFGVRTLSLAAGSAEDAQYNFISKTLSGSGPGLEGSFSTTSSYQRGLPLTADRGIGWLGFDVDRDPVTGLIVTSRDPNGRATKYRYDATGRLGRIIPPGADGPNYLEGAERITSICTYPGGSYRARDHIFVHHDVTVGCTTVAPQGPLAPIPQLGDGPLEDYQYDGFGRLLLEQKFTPGSLSEYRIARRRTEYASNGAVAMKGEWYEVGCASGSCYPGAPALDEGAPGPTFSLFDPFGRAQVVTQANGSLTTMSSTFLEGGYTIPFTDFYTETTQGGIQGVSGLITSVVKTRKDLFGRVLSIEEPGVGTNPFRTDYLYNVMDKLGRVTQTSGTGTAQVRSFSYDELGNLKEEQHPEHLGQATIFGHHDALGNVLERTAPGGQKVVYTFDGIGRLRTVGAIVEEGGEKRPAGRRALGGGGTTTIPLVENTYDTSNGAEPFLRTQFPNGRLSRRIAHNPPLSAGLPSFDVDQRYYYADERTGGLSSRTTDVKNVTNGAYVLSGWTEHWQYNDLGLVRLYSHPRDSNASPMIESIDYRHGLPVRLFANGLPLVQDVTFHPSGAVERLRTGPGQVPSVFPGTTYTVFQDGWMPRPGIIDSIKNPDDPRMALEYLYDAAGNLTRGGPSSSEQYKYDKRSQLVQSYVTGWDDYAYDDFGNLTYYRGVETLVDGASNRVTSVTYDARGNATSVPASLLNGSPVETLTYDALDRMTSAKRGALAPWYYSYDAAGERVIKSNGFTHIFMLRDLSNRIVTEVRTEGSAPKVQRDNFHLGGMPVATYSSPAAGGNPAPYWQFLHPDHLGTTRLAFDLNANEVGTVGVSRYRPFGEELAVPSGTNRLGFANMEVEAEEQSRGRQYDHARSFENRIGRFLSPDVLPGRVGTPATWNRYTYVVNNPLKYLDPDGRFVRLEGSLEERFYALNAVRRTLGDANRAKALTMDGDRLAISGMSSEAFAAGSPVAARLSALVGAKAEVRFGISLSSAVQSAGGGYTRVVVEGPNAYVISRVAPDTFSFVREDGTAFSQSAGVVHELLGHAYQMVFGGSRHLYADLPDYSIFDHGYSEWSDGTPDHSEADALFIESIWRSRRPELRRPLITFDNQPIRP